MPEDDADLLQVLISQVGKNREIDVDYRQSAGAYSEMPSFSSQSAICCIAAHPSDGRAVFSAKISDKRLT